MNIIHQIVQIIRHTYFFLRKHPLEYLRTFVTAVRYRLFNSCNYELVDCPRGEDKKLK